MNEISTDPLPVYSRFCARADMGLSEAFRLRAAAKG